MGFKARPARPRARATWRLRSLVPAAACVATISIGSTSITAVAQESPLSAIISDISRHEADINRINLEIGSLSEAVNRSLVDLHDAQSLAEQARRGAEEARKRLEGTQREVERAQAELDRVSRASYRSMGAGASLPGAGADARKDTLDRQTYLSKEADEKRATLEDLQRARTIAANEESTLRQASKLADERATAATQAEESARTTLEQSVNSLGEQLELRDAAVAELLQSQAELAEKRPDAAAVNTADAIVPTTALPTPDEAAEKAAGTSAAAGDARADSGDKRDAESTQRSEPSAPTSTAAPTPASTTETAPTIEPTTESAEPAPVAGPRTTTPSEPAAAQSSDGTSYKADADEKADNNATSSDAGAPSLSSFAQPDNVNAALDAFARAIGETQADHASLDNPYTDGGGTIAATSASGAVQEAETSVETADKENGTNVAATLPEIKDNKQVTDEVRGDSAATADDAARKQQIEAVIARAESQIGTPYVWGGGDANGPTTGINDGSTPSTGQSGYDCSGLVLYAYSGAGISLPHYTGYQYQRGEKIPVDKAERGDLLFWGDGGSQHVAIYLGDGMMLEAPQTGMNVQKAPVRRSGLAPYAVRLI